MPADFYVFSRTVLVVAGAVAFVSCGSLQKVGVLQNRRPRSAVAANVVPLKVGTVTLVNEAERFVLIDTGAAAVPPAGTALKSFTGELSSGVVTVGNVNRRPFVVADIVQGTPKKGDEVFQ